MSYIQAGSVLRSVVLYYLITPTPSNKKALEDTITNLPAKDYAIVEGEDSWTIALQFDHDYVVKDPSVFTVDGREPKMRDPSSDVFGDLRMFGIPFGPHRYNTTSLLGE